MGKPQKKEKLVDSEWIDCKAQKPTIPGVYKRNEGDGDIGWQRWTGVYWGAWYNEDEFEEAVADKDLTFKSGVQDGYWQGQIDA